MADATTRVPLTAEARQFWLADLSMVLVALIWGLNMAVMKLALARIDPYLFNATRLLVSAIVLGGIVWWQGAPILDRRPGARPVQKQVMLILLFSFTMGLAYQILFLVGIDNTSAGNTALIMSAIPMWTAILAFLLIGERLSKMAWLGLMLALIGTGVVTLTVPLTTGSDNSLWGNLIVSAAAFSWAIGSVWSRPIMNHISPTCLAFCAVTLSVPFHFLVAWHAIGDFGICFTDPWLLTALLFSGAFSTGLAYAFWNFGVKVLGTSHAAVFQNLVPVIALISGWLLVGEIPVGGQIIGGTVIIAGLVIMRRNR